MKHLKKFNESKDKHQLSDEEILIKLNEFVLSLSDGTSVTINKYYPAGSYAIDSSVGFKIRIYLLPKRESLTGDITDCVGRFVKNLNNISVELEEIIDRVSDILQNVKVTMDSPTILITAEYHPVNPVEYLMTYAQEEVIKAAIRYLDERAVGHNQFYSPLHILREATIKNNKNSLELTFPHKINVLHMLNVLNNLLFGKVERFDFIVDVKKGTRFREIMPPGLPKHFPEIMSDKIIIIPR